MKDLYIRSSIHVVQFWTLLFHYIKGDLYCIILVAIETSFAVIKKKKTLSGWRIHPCCGITKKQPFFYYSIP